MPFLGLFYSVDAAFAAVVDFVLSAATVIFFLSSFPSCSLVVSEFVAVAVSEFVAVAVAVAAVASFGIAKDAADFAGYLHSVAVRTREEMSWAVAVVVTNETAAVDLASGLEQH